jgi:VCBS repeat-containing protein
MRSVTFQLTTQTGNDEIAPATLTIAEMPDGTLSFTVSNIDDGDNFIGDIRGLFFDVSDDSLLGSLTVEGADVTVYDDNGDVTSVGSNSNTTRGIPDSPYEVGIEFGSQGIATDDIQTTSFTLASSLRDLTLDDISLENIAVRQQSVGEAGGERAGSDKLYGVVPYAVNAIDDDIALQEDQTASGNVFANDIDLDAGDLDGNGLADGLTVTAIDGVPGAVDSQIVLADGITLAVGADGSYVIDAQDADYLSLDETIDFSVTYNVDDGNGGSDSATLSITVTGVNDDPLAVADSNATDEASTVSGNVLANDSDIDRLDVLEVSTVNGDTAAVGSPITLDSGALLTMSADGTYVYDPNGAFDALNTGDQATDSFTYSVADGQGGFATTTVDITIDGVGGGDTGGGEDHFGTFTNKKGAEKAISNVVFYLKDSDGEFSKVKIDGWNSGETDLDNIDYDAFLDANFAGSELVAVSIKAGNNHNANLGPGEGQLFLLDGDEDIDYVEGGDVPAPLTIEILGAKADFTYDYSDSLFIG